MSCATRRNVSQRETETAVAQLRRIRTIFTGVAGTPWYSNMFFTWVAGTEQAHLDAVGSFWNAIDSQIDNNVSWAVDDNAAVINDTTGDITQIEVGIGPTGAGGGTSAPLPYANQGLVNWLTNDFIAGRQVRGKTYIPGLCEDTNTVSGVMEPVAQSVLQSTADALIAASSAPGPLRVFSRKNLTSAAVESAQVTNKWAVLRSRRD